MLNSKIYIILFLVLFSSSCATTLKPLNTKHEYINNWKITGKIAINSNSISRTSNFIWIQNKDNYEIVFFGPLGISRIKITGNNNFIKIVDTENNIVQGKDPENLINKKTNLALPILSLPYWLRGIENPKYSTDKKILDTNKQITNLTQQNWEIYYSKHILFDKKYKNIVLPSRIKATKNSVTMKILIRSFSVLP